MRRVYSSLVALPHPAHISASFFGSFQQLREYMAVVTPPKDAIGPGNDPMMRRRYNAAWSMPGSASCNSRWTTRTNASANFSRPSKRLTRDLPVVRAQDETNPQLSIA